MNGQQVSRALGFLSIGIGVAELLAPRRLGRVTGVGNHSTAMRMLALREIASGIGILSRKHSALWLWSRVAGDAMDLALLGTAFAGRRSDRTRIAAAAAAVAGITAVDTLCAAQMSRRNGTHARPKHGSERADHVHRSITIGRTPEELYSFWRKLENLSRVMENLISVQDLGGNRSRWVAKGPGGKPVEWDAEIINDEPNKLIAWRTLPGAQIEHAGTIRFEPAAPDRGTIVSLKMQYHPPGGRVGAAFARLFGRAPEQQIVVDLRRFKQLMETGEIATTEGQPAGRRSSISRRYDDVAKRLAAV